MVILEFKNLNETNINYLNVALVMGIKETLAAWLRPKDLSLVLEIEGNISGINEATYGKYYEMLEPKYAGRTVVLISGNQTTDGKTKFYVTPSIRGRRDNIAWEELSSLYPGALQITYYLESKYERDTIKAFAASTS